MGGHLEPLPLFPLHTVLFPYAPLQLHVFESRYRELIQYCSEEDTGFGIVLIRQGAEVGGEAEPYMVGTAVRIVDVRTNGDGTLAVQVVGQRRFRIRRMDDDRPYLVGQVERVVEMEVEDSPRCDALVLKTREYLKQYFEGHFAQFDMKVAEVRLHEDPTVLSFQVASLLHVDDRQKQYLLEMTDTLERLSTMLPMLEQLILEAEPGPVQPMHRQDHEGWIFKN